MLCKTNTDSSRSIMSKIQEDFIKTMQDNEWPVTCSIGLIIFKKPPVNVDDMIKKTDELMYNAKKSGKNCIKYRIIDI